MTPEKIVDDVTTILSGEGGFVVYQEPIGTETSSNTNEDTKMGWLHYGSGYRKQRKERRREEERRQRHLEHCETCREQEGETPDNRYVTEKSLSSNTGASSIRTIDVEVFTKTIVSIEGMTCASCTTSITSNLESHPSVSSAEINLLSSSGIIRHRLSLPASEVIELIEDAGFDASIISSDSETPPDSTQSSHSLEVWTSTFMIEGMTCASCSSAIDRALRDRPEIRDISIDVLGNKGVIVHNDSISHDTIKSIIEDLGYGAELISHEGQSKPKRQKGINADQQRTVSLRVQGVYCGDCITQINTHLRSLPLIRYTPVSLDHPISTVSYIPRKPLTIRTILDGLTDLAPEFDAEVVRPQSLSERSRQIQKKEVRMLAAHFGVALLFAIPTFIMWVGSYTYLCIDARSAIVGMVLVPSDNSFRQGLMTPLWGSANKGTLALWPLASVVQFGVGR